MGRFGFVSHQPLQGGTSAVTDGSGLAPGSRLDGPGGLGGHAHRPARLLGAADPNGPHATAGLHAHHARSGSTVPVAGSTGPADLLGGRSGHNPAGLAGQVGRFDYQPAGASPGAASPGGWAALRGPGDESGGGSGAMMAVSVPGGPPPGDHDDGGFQFTLTAFGQDGQGAYTIRATGTGTFSLDSTGTDTGSITITAQIHRGGGGVSAGDPATTATTAFDPGGAGLLFGFDFDGYAAGATGADVAGADSYILSASGSDSFTDKDSETDVTSPTDGETDTDTSTYTDSGTDTFNLTVTGGGAGGRTYSRGGTSTVQNFTATDDDTDVRPDGSGTDTETYHDTDTGSDAETAQEGGTVGPDGAFTMTSFTVTDHVSDTDAEADEWDGPDGDTASESDTATGTEDVTVTGTADGWTLTLHATAGDDIDDSDSGTDHATAPGVDGGTADDTDTYHDSLTGGLTETADVSASAQGDDVSIGSMTLTTTGTLAFDDGDTDAETDTAANGDTGTDTASETATGTDGVTLTVTGGDAVGYSVTETENITDGFTDEDDGGDTWDDPAGAGGEETGSDTFHLSDIGSETDAVTTGGTLAADGAFTLTSFAANITGSATFTDTDSGSDTDALGAETDTDQFADSDTGTDGYSTTLGLGDGGAITVTTDQTIAGTDGSSDDETDGWPSEVDGAAAHETDHRTDSDSGTDVVHQTGVMGSDGSVQVTGGFVTADGTDTTTDDDAITADEALYGQNEAVDQHDIDGGTDGYHTRVDEQGGAITSLTDDETINGTVNDRITLAPVAGGSGTTVSGTASLVGSAGGTVQETGHAGDDGTLVLDPASGGDHLDLTGTYHLETTAPAPAGYYSFSNGPGRPGGVATPRQVTVKTVFDDPGLHEAEADSDAAGEWTVGSVAYQDHSTVTVTTTADYTGGQTAAPLGYGPLPGWDGTGPPVIGPIPDTTATTTGTDVDVVQETLDETENGSGAGVSGTRTTFHSETRDQNLSWQTRITTGSQNHHYQTSEKHVTVGGDGPDGVFVGTDTETTHEENRNTLLSTFTPLPGDQWKGGSWNFFDASVDDRVAVAVVGSDEDGTLTSVTGGGSLTDRALTQWGGVIDEKTHQEAWRNVLAGDGTGGGQAVTVTDADNYTGWTHGTDDNGNPVDSHYDPDNVPPYADPPADGFDAAASFGAAVADKITGGLTREVRQGLGYDDAVKYNSTAYAAGAAVGTVMDVALSVVPVCQAAKLASYGLKAYHAVQASGLAVESYEAFAAGDIPGGLVALAGAAASAVGLGSGCFEAGTPIRDGSGRSKPVEAYRSYEEFGDACDAVLARSEFDPAGPVTPRRVLRTFRRTAPVVDLVAAGRTIGVTADHPFWAAGKGWTPAGELVAGDVLVGHDGQRVAVEGVRDAGRVAAVYNVEVEGDHTYFVGDDDWGCDLWSHNLDCRTALRGVKSQVYRYGSETYRLNNKGLRHILTDHYPKYFSQANREGKKVTTFFSKSETVKGIQDKIRAVMNQNAAQLSQPGMSGEYFSILGTIKGKVYQLGFSHGRVGQFFPRGG